MMNVIHYCTRELVEYKITYLSIVTCCGCASHISVLLLLLVVFQLVCLAINIMFRAIYLLHINDTTDHEYSLGFTSALAISSNEKSHIVSTMTCCECAR